MEEKKIVYYLIHDRVIAKREKDGDYDRDYILRAGRWVEDSGHLIMDHLVGYDPSEPEDSPYRFGSTSVLMEMDEIPVDQAISIINQQILDALKNKWKVEFATKKEEWNKNPGWPAKLVETKFTLNGEKYSLFPVDIGLTNDCWDQGFMETIQSDIEKDLKLYGATEIYNLGFLD